jgi:hypothetical protein
MTVVFISRLTRVASSAFGEGTVVIEIGPEHKKYYVHRALLIQYSEYFRKALQGPWKEAQNGVVRLEDIDHRVCKKDSLPSSNRAPR